MFAIALCVAANQAVLWTQYYGGEYNPEQLRMRLGRGDGEDKSLFDPKLCGSYIAILAKPDTAKWTAGHAFSVLSQMPRVHPYLLSLAGRWATNKEQRVRAAVADFYAAHGDRRQLSIITMMLYDPIPIVCYSAADAIPRIGTREMLIAVDVWLAHPPHPTYDDLIMRVAKKRRELADSLAK